MLTRVASFCRQALLLAAKFTLLQKVVELCIIDRRERSWSWSWSRERIEKDDGRDVDFRKRELGLLRSGGLSFCRRVSVGHQRGAAWPQ